MVQINFATREVSCKIVYYGPGLCGKTTNLQQVHTKAPTELRGNLTSIATEGDRTLFFDFMPLELGTVAGMRTKLQLYTVPGQVFYNATRKIVLEGADGIIFVADSSRTREQANRDSWQNLKENLREYGRDVRDVPLVLQFNKRDVPDAMPTEEMRADLNELGVPTFEAVATTGEGVMPTLGKLAGMVLEKLNEQRPRRTAPRPAAVPKGVAATGTATARQAPAGRRAEPTPQPVVAKEATAPAVGKPKAEAERPAPKVTAPEVTAPRVTAPKVTTARAAETDTAKVAAEVPSAGPVSGARAGTGRSATGRPVTAGPATSRPATSGRPTSESAARPHITLAATRKKAPLAKALVVLGIVAIVAVVLLVLLLGRR
jgi:hypothetical protein